MYQIANTLLSAVLIYMGATHVEGGWLSILALIAGGIYLGHVLTEALNDPTE